MTQKSTCYTVNGMTIDLNPGNLALRRFSCGKQAWLDNGSDGASLWQLHVADAMGRRVDLDSLKTSKGRARMDGDILHLTWPGVRDAASGAGPFDVGVTIAPSAAGPNLTAWRLSVNNRSKGWTIWHMLFPRLRGLKAGARPAEDRLFWPELWGMQTTGWENLGEVSGPCGGYGKQAMQFMGFSHGRRSLYMGAHDPRHWQKMMAFKPETKPKGKSAAELHFLVYPSGMTKAGNSYEQPYDVVVGEVTGDWFDAAKLYAAFARVQPWACQRPALADQGPRENREVLIWEQASINAYPHDRLVSVNGLAPADWVAKMKTLRRRLGARVAVHMYHWHQTPFDTNYPDYFPVKRGFRKLVSDLKAADVAVMPYINGRLWDQAAPSYGPDAERNAEKISAQRVNPKTLYAWPESYGNGQLLTGMCLHTPYWRKIVVNLCRRIVKELGCGGIYLDQLGCFGGRICLDPGHGHPLGAGDYWLNGFRNLIMEIRKEVGPGPLLTTENNWEGCVADFDALLDTSWNKENNLPVFPAVYGGLGAIYGGDVFKGVYQNGGETFVQRMGMRFVWGGQFGWGHFEPLLEKGNESLMAYFTSLCRLRTEWARLFCRGEFLRPPEVRLADGTICTNPLKGPVLASMWRDPDADRAVVFLVNVTRKAQRGRVRFAGSSGRVSAGFDVKLAPLESAAVPVTG